MLITFKYHLKKQLGSCFSQECFLTEDGAPPGIGVALTWEARGVDLSPEATAVFFYPAGPGRLQFAAAGTGMVRDFSAGYHYNLRDKHTILAEINPVMNHLVLGWSWHWGEICLYLDRFEPALVRGLKISFGNKV